MVVQIDAFVVDFKHQRDSFPDVPTRGIERSSVAVSAGDVDCINKPVIIVVACENNAETSTRDHFRDLLSTNSIRNRRKTKGGHERSQPLPYPNGCPIL